MKELEKILLPKEWEPYFEIESIEEKTKEINIKVVEKETCIPEMSKRRSFGKKIVLNGYMPLLEITDFPLRGNPVYLKVQRRRWKISGTSESYHNEYELHPKGLKCTPEFGNFLKELTGSTRHKFFQFWQNIRNIREEDFSLVSRIKRIFQKENSRGSS